MAAAVEAAPPAAAVAAQQQHGQPPDMEAFLRQAKYPLIKYTDMTAEMREEAMDVCITAVEKYPQDVEKCTQARAGWGRSGPARRGRSGVTEGEHMHDPCQVAGHAPASMAGPPAPTERTALDPTPSHASGKTNLSPISHPSIRPNPDDKRPDGQKVRGAVARDRRAGIRL